MVMEVVVKDSNFFSNARKPLVIELKEQSLYPLSVLPIHFQNSDSPNVNFSRIQEMKVYFYRQTSADSVLKKSANIDYWQENWVIIKDITVSAKEER